MQLFSDFYEAEIEAFVRAAEHRELPADHVFFTMGSANDCIYIICQGLVRVERACAAGDVPIATLGPGQTFGEMSFMDGSLTAAKVVAHEPTEVLMLCRSTVDEMVAGHPRLALKLWRNLALDLKRRLVATDELITSYVDLEEGCFENHSVRQFLARR